MVAWQKKGTIAQRRNLSSGSDVFFMRKEFTFETYMTILTYEKDDLSEHTDSYADRSGNGLQSAD